MQKRHRIRKSKDFAAARRKGKSWANNTLVLVARRTDNECSRFGFSVSKRVGNAVVRNRIKRRLKEAARAEYLPRLSESESWDLVVIARQDAAKADYHRLNRSLRRLFRRAKIIDDRANRQTANGAGSPAGSSPK